MVWPLLSKDDILSLCEPFPSLFEKKSSKMRQAKAFSGVVFFDIGSVLIDLDWEGFWNAISNLFNPSHDFSIETFKSLIKKENIHAKWSQGKISAYHYVETVMKILKLSCRNTTLLKHSYLDIKHADSFVIGTERIRVLQLAKNLKEKNFVVGLLSNTTPWHLLLLYEKLQPTKNFDINIFSCDVGYEKPDEQIYKIAHKEAYKFVKNKFNLELEKEDVYFVDDTPANVRQALDFGWNARLVNLVENDILNEIKCDEINDYEFQQASQKRENLLFAEQAAERVESLFGNFLT